MTSTSTTPTTTPSSLQPSTSATPVTTPSSSQSSTSATPVTTPSSSQSSTSATPATTPSSSQSYTPTTPATPPPSPPSCTATPPKHLSRGAVGEIGIGCAIVGALVACLFFWIFMQRSRHSRPRKHRRSRDVGLERPLRHGILLDENLLERADDSEIRKSMLELNDLIDQHVENYYNLKAFDGKQGGLEFRLAECGFGKELSTSAGEIASVLKHPKTRFAGIRHLIAAIIVKNINHRAGTQFSLLSPKISTFCQSIPPLERQAGCDEVYDQAFTKWRQMSAFLLSPTRSNREPPQANERELQNALTQNVSLLDSVLAPFIKTGDIQKYREDNLKAIIFQGAQLGILLFSQPSNWVFGWNVSSGAASGSHLTMRDISGARRWVLFPGIAELVVERHGRQKVREVVAPVTVDL